MENEKKTLEQKLASLRAHMARQNLKKSGYNNHAGFAYYELGDFLPDALIKMEELHLVGIIDFATNDKFVLLHIIDTDDPTQIGRCFYTEKAAVEIQGAKKIQNIGGEHTYQRRYLWMDALEISDPDFLDATSGRKNKENNQDQIQPRESKWINKQQEAQILALGTVAEIEAAVKKYLDDGKFIGSDRVTRIEARKKALSESKQTTTPEVTPPATVKKPDEDMLFATLGQMQELLSITDTILLKDKKDKILKAGGHFTKIQGEQLVAHFKNVSELSGKKQPKHDLDEIFDSKKIPAEAMTEITATDEELNQLDKLL